MFRAVGDTSGQAWALRVLEQIAHYQGDYEQATIYATESLTLTLALGDRHRQADVLISLASLARAQGDDARAAAYLVESLSINRELGTREDSFGISASWGASQSGRATRRRRWRAWRRAWWGSEISGTR